MSSAAYRTEDPRREPSKGRAPHRNRSHFQTIERWQSEVLRHPGLTGSERLYLTTLVKRINANNLAWPAHATSCAECGVSRSTAQRALRKAQELGLLEREARFEANGRQTSNYYRLVLPQTWDNPFEAPQGHVDTPETPSLTPLEASPKQDIAPLTLAAATKIGDVSASGQRASAARVGLEVEASTPPATRESLASTRKTDAAQGRDESSQGAICCAEQAEASEEAQDLVSCWRELGIKATAPSVRALMGYGRAELRTALLWFCARLIEGRVYRPAGLFLHVLRCVHRGEKPIFDYSVGDIALVLEGHHPTELKQRRLALLEQAEHEELVQPAEPQPSGPTEAQPVVVEYVKSRFAEGRVDEVVPEDAEGAMQALDLTKREGRRRAIHWAALLVIRKVLDMRQASELFTGVLSQQHSQARRALTEMDRSGGYIEIESHAYELNIALGRVLRC